MGKKMKFLPSFFKSRESPERPWQWPICGNSRTPSFRAAGDEIFKTVNSVFFDNLLSDPIQFQTPDSWFTNSSIFDSDDEFEVVVRGAKSERLIFEPGETDSILQKSTDGGDHREAIRFEGSVVLAMESEDPYLDFRRSMEEMVESHGIRDWECLEALLNWYLRVNRTKNHGYILGAFVDLLVDLGGDGGGDGASTDSTSIFSDELVIETSPSSIA
ncbi:transcription repressor OFP13-like [Momordica charantia]|uniref:Transcription repressor n=1 Tax=Momordica charantia TaxID=3673 RepID=A0A6J1BX55_MOMCH|nr:transcription repressor OFP13-like [Momordica charantia]